MYELKLALAKNLVYINLLYLHTTVQRIFYTACLLQVLNVYYPLRVLVILLFRTTTKMVTNMC